MKIRLVPLCILVLCLMASCTKNEFDEAVLKRGQLEFVNGKKDLSFYSSGGSEELFFETGDSWTIKTDASWLEVSPLSGKGGLSKVLVTSEVFVEKETSRTATFTIITKEKEYPVQVIQSSEGEVAAPEDTFKIGAEGGTIDVPIEHSIGFDFKIYSPWVKCVQTKALTKSVLTLQVEANDADDARPRDTFIRFTSKDKMDNRVVRICQEAKPYLEVLDELCTFQDAGDIQRIEFSSNVPVKCGFSGTEPEWLEIIDHNKKDVNGLYSVESYTFALKNLSRLLNPQEAVFTVKSEDGKLVRTCKIAYTPEFGCQVDKDIYTVSADAQELTVKLNSDQPLEVALTDSWITYVSQGKGEEYTHELKFSILENTGVPRVARIGIVYDHTVVVPVFVKQEGKLKSVMDPAFEKNLFYNGFDCDADGILSQEELDKVTELHLYSPADLTSIAYLTNLEKLTLEWNTRSYIIDFGTHANLKELNVACPSNSMNLTGLSGLKKLSVSNNLVSAIDLSGNPLLDSLALSFCYELRTLDLSPCTALKTLHLSELEDFGELDLSSCGKLAGVFLSSLPSLRYLDVSGHEALKELHISSGPDMVLHLDGCSALTRFEIIRTGLLNIKGLEELNSLSYLKFFGADIYGNFELGGFPVLDTLNLCENNFRELKVTDCPELECMLAYGNNDLLTLTIDAPALKKLDVDNCYSLTHCHMTAPQLVEFSATEADLAGLSLNAYPALKTLDLSCNRYMYELDLSCCPELESVELYESKLTHIVLNNPKLKYLDLNYCYLGEVDLTKSPLLENAYLNMNSLRKVYIPEGMDKNIIDCWEHVEIVTAAPVPPENLNL